MTEEEIRLEKEREAEKEAELKEVEKNK